MKMVVKRLIHHGTVSINVKSFEHSPLHHALFIGNYDIINMLSSLPDFEAYYEDQTYVYQAAISNRQTSLRLIFKKLMNSGKTIDQILMFPFKNSSDDFIMHVVARNGNFEGFFRYILPSSIAEDNFCVQNSHGETLLHCLLLNVLIRARVKIKLITKLVERCPKLMFIRNNKKQLPLHISFPPVSTGQSIYNHLCKLMVKHDGSPDIFFEDVEVAVATLEEAILFNTNKMHLLSTFSRVLESHGMKIFNKCLRLVGDTNKLMEGFKPFPMINPNQFCDGTNGFLSLASYDSIPKLERYGRLQKLIQHYPIDDINARDSSRTTLFMYIVGFWLDNEYIKSLIQTGADCKAINNENNSCLHYAATNLKNLNILKLLLDNGADPTVATKSRELPIHYAIHCENMHALECLGPFLSDDDLKRKCGKLEGTLLHYSARVYGDAVFKFIWQLYKDRKSQIDVNDTNSVGESVLSTAILIMTDGNIEFIFQNHTDDINFHHSNQFGETIAHALSTCFVKTFESDFFKKRPNLIKAFNDQLNIPNNEDVTPIDIIAKYCKYKGAINENWVKLIMKNITRENFEKNIHKFVKSSVMRPKLIETFPDILSELRSDIYYQIFQDASDDPFIFTYFLEKLSSKLSIAKSSDGKNILHLVFKKNDAELIDAALKALTENEFEELITKIDHNGNTPIVLLDDYNKNIFEKAFLFYFP